MKQILVDFSSGNVRTIELPVPALGDGEVLIRSDYSLISLGTERMLVEFGSASLLGKARQQPDKVKDVLSKIANDGLVTTINAVNSKLNLY